MADENTDREYSELLKQSELRGEMEQALGGGERRQHPRVRAEAADIEVEGDPWVFLINVSSAGMAFYSENEFEAGKELNITLEDGSMAKANVISSTLEDEGAEWVMGQYRVSCIFPDEAQGKALVLKIKQNEESHLEDMA
jgi:hypothetical protein